MTTWGLYTMKVHKGDTPVETVEGTPAVWPVTHTFYSEERSEQISIAAETAASARQLLGCCSLFKLTYVQSVDAEGRFVYDFN